MRRSCAIPRASRRSVLTVIADKAAFLTVIADKAAFTCRVSRRTTSKPASVNAACNHCDKGPASSPNAHDLDLQRRRIAHQSLRLGSHLRLPDDLARAINDANRRLFQ